MNHSTRRLVPVLAVLLSSLATSFAVDADVLLKNENPATVASSPTGGNPKFTITKLTTLDSIYTYHWNAGAGKAPGQIWLVGGPNNQKYGPWAATVSSKVYWVVTPKVPLPAGTYSVFDSDPATWSHNASSKNQGFVQVYGTPVDLNTLTSFDDVKGRVAALSVADRPKVLDSLSDDRKGPVQASFGIIPKPAVKTDKTAISGVKAEVATLKLTNPFAGHRYNAILLTPGGSMSFLFRDGVVTIPASSIVNGYPIKATKAVTLKVMDTTIPQGWSAWTEVGTITLTVSP